MWSSNFCGLHTHTIIILLYSVTKMGWYGGKAADSALQSCQFKIYTNVSFNWHLEWYILTCQIWVIGSWTIVNVWLNVSKCNGICKNNKREITIWISSYRQSQTFCFMQFWLLLIQLFLNCTQMCNYFPYKSL